MPPNNTRRNNQVNNRWGTRKATITRAFNAQRGTRPNITRNRGSRNLMAANREKASRVVRNIFSQGVERRDRVINHAKTQYGYTNNNIHFIEQKLNAVGVYD